MVMINEASRDYQLETFHFVGKTVVASFLNAKFYSSKSPFFALCFKSLAVLLLLNLYFSGLYATRLRACSILDNFKKQLKGGKRPIRKRM